MFVQTESAKIFVREQGAGEPLLLIHGLGMSSDLWVNQIPAFAEHYRTVAVDLRGFGQSSKPDHPGAYRIDELAKDIAAVIENLGLAKCHVLGTSMGGFVAQALALERPELCDTLMLCHTAPRMSIPADVLATRVKALGKMSLDEYANIVVEQALSPNADPELCEWLANMLVKNDKRAYTQVLTEGLTDFDVGEKLKHIAHRTLVVTGELDLVLPRIGGQEIAELIPNATYVDIPAVGHIGYAEDPTTFNNAVLGFLQ